MFQKIPVAPVAQSKARACLDNHSSNSNSISTPGWDVLDGAATAYETWTTMELYIMDCVCVPVL
ncbi:hypothetical protein [Desulfonatronum sp. SC1]|uniref:hypothetical protein n=1 Tax=Desulfonatronum sp. SC1 TaxID=2109626 RepID=UPI000D327082|nr:hypothetical protein [Desulfonatronum sp. SC1]PTN33778.1 hypothetical protein C6366_13900 [Desulfonatronum sp. SC1]